MATIVILGWPEVHVNLVEFKKLEKKWRSTGNIGPFTFGTHASAMGFLFLELRQ